VAVIFTGGTISMTVDPVAGGAVPTLAGAELLGCVPGLDELAEIVTVDRGRTPASHFSFADVLAIGAAIEAALADPVTTGVVVVQGTDTMEETAFRLGPLSRRLPARSWLTERCATRATWHGTAPRTFARPCGLPSTLPRGEPACS